ncbi:MAG: hypothetical protein HN919_01840 [Verrucomicrobia bacterium]|jgi:hypothetical protein|nr:hypothetical protein [Verrucomicrobiota bacterium]MBT7065019.1 hypothetical protein [Verrucomicrobiota bacterium]MBT7701358.1 hypothetical protein [Verrucomicrobiota bacterium]
MKQIFTLIMGIMIVVGLGTGCGKADKSAETSPEAEKEQWEPESIPVPEGHSADDGHDHSGHDHSAHAD